MKVLKSILLRTTEQSVESLAEELGIENPSDYYDKTINHEFSLIMIGCKFTEMELYGDDRCDSADKVFQYLTAVRGLNAEEIDFCNLGYTNKNRILEFNLEKMFPKATYPCVVIPTFFSSCYATYLQLRAVEVKSYRYPYGVHREPVIIGDLKSNTLILCEGFFDGIHIFRQFPDALIYCTTVGTCIYEVISNFKGRKNYEQKKVMLAFDNDPVGKKLNLSAKQIIFSLDYQCELVYDIVYSDGEHDPTSIEKIEFRDYIKNATPYQMYNVTRNLGNSEIEYLKRYRNDDERLQTNS